MRIIQDNSLISILTVTISKNTQYTSSSPDDRHTGMAKTSAIHRISTQLYQRTHSAHLPEVIRGLLCCKFHQVVEPCFLPHGHCCVELLWHVRSDPQGEWYRYFYITVTEATIILRVRGCRNCQNDEAKDKKLHVGIYRRLSEFRRAVTCNRQLKWCNIIPYPTAFPYGNGMVLHFYQQQESSTTKTVYKVINKGLKAYV